MIKAKILFVALLGLSATARAGDFAADRMNNWHHWRGPEANGFVPYGNPPVEWDQDTNIKWKVPIAGEGSATPIIWGDNVFILTAIKTERTAEQPAEAKEKQPAAPQPGRRRVRLTTPPTNDFQFVVMCLDRETGQVRWQQVAREELPHEGHHRTNTYASGSPTTDGRYLYVSFGSRGLFCYDTDGNLQWELDLGEMRTRFGFGEASTPVIYGDSLIVMWDQEDQSKIYVLDARNGDTRWQADRDEPSNWSTPLVVEHNGRTQVITNGTTRARSYDLASGELLWECGGQTTNAIPSPVATSELAFCMSGLRGNAAYAIPLDASGDLTDTDKVAWSRDSGAPYVPSPLLYGDVLYMTAGNNAVFAAINAASGEAIFERERLPGVNSFYASPVGVAGRIYLTSREGTTLVVKQGDELEILSTNELEERIDASPAVVGKELFLRSAGNLYCISEG